MTAEPIAVVPEPVDLDPADLLRRAISRHLGEAQASVADMRSARTPWGRWSAARTAIARFEVAHDLRDVLDVTLDQR